MSAAEVEAVRAVKAVAERWDAVLAEVLADSPSAAITNPEVLALDTCLRELRAALAEAAAVKRTRHPRPPRPATLPNPTDPT